MNISEFQIFVQYFINKHAQVPLTESARIFKECTGTTNEPLEKQETAEMDLKLFKLALTKIMQYLNTIKIKEIQKPKGSIIWNRKKVIEETENERK